MDSFGHIIDGAERESADGASMSSIDPYLREAWAEVAEGGTAEAALAVTAARRAFDEGPWPRMGFAERGAALHRLAGLIDENAAELAMADTRDMGKPITAAMTWDLPRTAQTFRFFADHARLATAETYPMDSGHHGYSRYEPAGVVAAIAPWNYPLMLESSKVAPALAWGNTVVLKPAETTPVSATMLGRLALEAGIPPGVVNVVHGYGPMSAGAALTEDPRVDRISFTGESTTGRVITAAAARNLTPVSLELGGKGANIVFADADLDAAVSWSIKGIYTNAGQVCLAGSRLYVERPILDDFLKRFVGAAEELVTGDPKDPATELGPVASAEHHRKVSRYLRECPGTVLTGGGGEGWLIRPTVIADVAADAAIQRDEVFGPVVTVTPFDSEAEVVRAANDTRYGLSALLFTENLSRAHRVARRLRAGTIWVNCFLVRDLRAPFGGFADSGWGREGGEFSREFYTEPKFVAMTVPELPS
ncbi:aldehyde dehydrogenase [Amycolatopsis jejuensis]|uniref:aldehyde dehydrogenase n=1 Tax=Amycolatopsis jejuensis TaxID=330084 RepID=UPI000524B1BC|nr:aldehyde dehydrogenase [Amycolatopsis jejuensis]